MKMKKYPCASYVAIECSSIMLSAWTHHVDYNYPILS